MLDVGASMEHMQMIEPTYDVLGIPVSATSLDEASKKIIDWAKDDVGRMVFIRDVHGVMQAQADQRLLALHKQAAMVTPDGMPLVWIGRRQGMSVSRTCGPDLMLEVLARSEIAGIRHFFFGGKDGVAQRLVEVFAERHPNLKIVGAETPPFRDLTDGEVTGFAATFNECGADVVWVGLSTPKQEFLMERLRGQVSCTLIGVGAAFDFHTGTIRRAPRWMQRAGLEWLWRLGSEPRRLWRRYVILAPLFVWKIMRGSHQP